MSTPRSAEAEFIFASCGSCRKAVLTHVIEVDAEGRESRRCVHCDGEVGEDWRLVTASELGAHGYELVHNLGCRGEGGCGSGCAPRSRH
ncbi:MAG: hypothetical protein HY699_11940 [Deltaproteobacteria bacterium]|nr:hypothetical protein [Deltaproteobacteria bacterium]